MKKTNNIIPRSINNEELIPPFERLMKTQSNPQLAHAQIEKMLLKSKDSLFTAINKV